MNSPIFNAEATGLTLVPYLYNADDRDSAWAAASTSGVSVVELAHGNYYVSGLPEAAGRERYHLIVAASGTPNVGVFGWQYGAVPGESVVHRVVTEIPDAPREFRQGDTHGTIALVVTSGLPEAIGDAETGVTWSQSAKDSDDVLTERSASIGSVAEDTATGTWGATLTYDLEADSLANEGLHYGLFVVTYPDGTIQTLPSTDSLTFNVLPVIVEPAP